MLRGICALIVAVAMQASPARVCAWEQIALGSTCHERDGSDAHHTDSTADHHCVCDAPGMTMHRPAGDSDGCVLWAIAAPVPSEQVVVLRLLERVALVARPPPLPPDACCNLPLLN
jgi:hypothetical protein